MDGLRTAVVSDAALGVLVADTHPLAGRDEVEWADLTGRGLLLYDRDHAPGYHDALLEGCAAGCRRPNVRSGASRRSLFVTEPRHGGDVVALRPRWDRSDGGAFGPVWTAKVLDAVGGRVPVGSVTYGAEATRQLYDLFEA